MQSKKQEYIFFAFFMAGISGCKIMQRRNNSFEFRNTGGFEVKKACILTLIFVLTATLFCGCGNRGNNTTGPMAPAASSSTKPTLLPKPNLPLPSGTTGTNPGGMTDPSNTTNPGDTTGLPGRAARPSARGPRY